MTASDRQVPQAAVEAVAPVVAGLFTDGLDETPDAIDRDTAAGVLAFLRDAIHADGPTGDAVRDALGLRVEMEDACSNCAGVVSCDDYGRHRRRVVGEWREQL